jgi:hypothetical protein
LLNVLGIRYVNPGCCFKAAGWHTTGFTKGGLIILEYTEGKMNKLFGIEKEVYGVWTLPRSVDTVKRLTVS